MNVGAGFFPADPPNLTRFSERYLSDSREIDILGSWLSGEVAVLHELRSAHRVPLSDLEPYYHRMPWSAELAGKTVLVVSPFSRSIEAQYQRRELLFSNHTVLPEFTLRTLTAVQSSGETGSGGKFRSWFEALGHMCDSMDKIEFDIAIVGAGAYGMSLAAHAKRRGRKAVVLGGATQILFGIRGKRWDEHQFFRSLFNEHWIRPSDDERPATAAQIEGGCYW